MIDISNCKWEELLNHYVLNPKEFWEVNRVRQANKLEYKLELLENIHKCSRESLIQIALSVVKRRSQKTPPTIFLISAGSSGSHWLECMIADCFDYEVCEEVYFPNVILQQFNRFNQNEIDCIMDGVHLLHTSKNLESLIHTGLINSAHYSGWKYYDYISKPKYVIFLIRNLSDIIMSRTYRKDEYKNYLVQALSNNSYLKKNIEEVKSFYKKSMQMRYNLLLKYENLLNDPILELKKINKLLSSNVSQEKMKKVIFDHSKENQIKVGLKPNSNLNMKKRKEVDLKDKILIEDSISIINQKLGY